MLLRFFQTLRDYKLPVSTGELLDCLQLLQSGLVRFNYDDFYVLCRCCLVKNERLYDKYDVAFAAFLAGLKADPDQGLFEDTEHLRLLKEVLYQQDRDPADYEQALKDYQAIIQKLDAEHAARMNDPESKDAVTRVPGEPMDPTGQAQELESAAGDESAEPSANAIESHPDPEPGDGDSGESGETGDEGDSGEEGDDGHEGEKGDRGERGEGDDGNIGYGESNQGTEGAKETFTQARQQADALWARRRFEDLDDDVELGTRNLKIALRRIRKFARTGAHWELDLATTITNTARNGGLLDIVEVPERHNSVKVLLLLDIGGSMDEYVTLCQQLFAAAKYEFKFLEYYYFHNFIYEKVWTDNERRDDQRVLTLDLLRKFSADYKIIFVGDAAMARHEILEKGGSVEHYNAEPGQAWLARIREHFRHVVWLNPTPRDEWWNSDSIQLIRRLLDDEMYPLNVTGIDLAARSLTR